MKKYVFLIASLFALPASGQIQISIPETPRRIEFADVIINLDEASRKTVDETVNSLLTPPNSFLDAKLERMQWYFPIIERILEEENVPLDLKYIAVMESSLIPEAVSTSNAVGFWQFKKSTGEELGLSVSDELDERKYIIASTQAAALYFKRNNLIFKNWISSIYSFYQGPTGASKEIPEEWSYASEISFNSKTPSYLIKALAHRIAFEHRLNRLKSSPRVFIEYPTQAKSLSEIANELTVDITELQKYNSWLNAPRIPEGKLYTVLIPVRIEDADEIKSRMNQRRDIVKVDVGFPQLRRISPTNADPSLPVLFDINDKKGILAQPGDEVAQLAKKGDVKIYNFLKFNDMGDRDMVKTGQVYYLQSKSKKAKVPFHTVMGDQTLWDISQMYGVQLKHLLKYNRFTSVQRLQQGRVLWLQKKRPKKQPIEIIKEAVPLEQPKKELPVKEDFETKMDQNSTVASTPKNTEVPKRTEPKKPLIEAKNDKANSSEQRSVFTNSKSEMGSREELPIYRENTTTYTEREGKMHRVKRGETLFSISKKYGMTVSELRALNNMSKSDILKFDQVLNVSPSSSTFETNAPSSSLIETETMFHTVIAGETLFSISKKYNMTIGELKSMNSLSSNTISIGQALKVSGRSNNKSTESHVVRSGETLFSISKKYNTTVGRLKEVNSLSSNNIMVGQILVIK